MLECRSRCSSRGLERVLGVAGVIAESICGLRGANADGFGSLVAESDFHAVNTIYGGVAGWRAAQGSDQGIGNKAHMHQVILHGFGEIEAHQHSALTDVQLTQDAQIPNSAGMSKMRSPKNTTGMVVFQYTTNLARAANLGFWMDRIVHRHGALPMAEGRSKLLPVSSNSLLEPPARVPIGSMNCLYQHSRVPVGDLGHIADAWGKDCTYLWVDGRRVP